MALLKPLTAYITGIGSSSAGGIGVEMIRYFLEKDWKVFAPYEEEAAAEMEELIRSTSSDRLTATRIDSCHSTQIESFVRRMEEQCSGLELFLHCGDMPERKGGLFDMGNYDQLAEDYDRSALGMLRHLEQALPLLARGERKRIAMVSSKDHLINSRNRKGSFVQPMTGVARHMAGAIIFNDLNAQGYRFRVFCRDKEGFSGAPDIYRYLLQRRSFDAGSPLHSDEMRYVARDGTGREYAW